MKKIILTITLLLFAVSLTAELHTNRPKFKLDNPQQYQIVIFDENGRLINASDAIPDSLDLKVLTSNSIFITELTDSTRLLKIVGGKIDTTSIIDWLSGTANEVAITDDGDGTATIGLPSLFILTSNSKVDVSGNNTYFGEYTGNNQDYSNGFGYSALRNNTGTGSNGFGYSALYNNTGTNSNGFGHYALQYNTGTNSNGFGSYALQNNTGITSNGFGYSALQYNTGTASNGFGSSALRNNTGTASNGFGSSALRNNTGTGSNGFGSYALQNNTGTASNGFGYYALQNNTGTNSNGFGYSALRNNDGNYNTAFGDNSFNTFTEDTGNAKTFVDGNVDVDTDYITITSHGFGATGSYLNLKASTTGVLPTGLTAGSIYQFKIINANTIECITADITAAAGGGTHTLTPQKVYTNSTAIGYNAEPDASNQIMLGDANVTEVKTAASISNCNNLKTYKGVFDVIDTGEITFVTGVAGFGEVMIGDNQEWAQIRFTSEGVVTLVDSSANVTTTNDTDAKLNIYDGGSGIVIENQLGSTLKVAINISYYTP